MAMAMSASASSILSTINTLPSQHSFLSCHSKKLSDHSSPKAFSIRNGPMPLKEDKSTKSDSSSSSTTTSTNQVYPPSPFFIRELSIPFLSPIPHQILPSEQSNEDLGNGSDGALSDRNSDVSALGASQNGFVGDMDSCKEQGPRCAWPRVNKQSSLQTQLGPRCPWPRSKTSHDLKPHHQQIVTSANSGLPYIQQQKVPNIKDSPKCSWPRASVVSTLETSNQSQKKLEEVETVQGPRCPWPRAIISSSSIGLSNHVFATGIGLSFINYLLLGAPELVIS